MNAVAIEFRAIIIIIRTSNEDIKNERWHASKHIQSSNACLLFHFLLSIKHFSFLSPQILLLYIVSTHGQSTISLVTSR